MRMVDLIETKRNGHALTNEEIQWMIENYMNGNIPDYQMSAFLMAVMFQSMNDDETTALTFAMMNSGDLVDLSEIEGVKVDKHSTGGVGDKTTLVLAPIVASLGVPVAKMSGRGLGHTGGTLDKLESIPGLLVDIDESQFLSQVKDINIAVIGQSKDLVPADKRLYALRDVTATVGSIPLIASSIMSKKLACGTDAILLDVKYGHGAFMKTPEEAKKLAEQMIRIGQKMNREVRAMVSNMNQPLGNMIGNMMEVKEAVATLKGKGPDDFRELCLTGASHLLVMAKKASSFDEAYQLCRQQLENGQAFETFKQMVKAQGGDTCFIEDFSLYPQPKYQKVYHASQTGYIKDIDSLALGVACMKAGAGRMKKEDTIDPLAGMELYAKIGDYVTEGEKIAKLLSNLEITKEIDDLINHAYTYTIDTIKKESVIEMEVFIDD